MSYNEKPQKNKTKQCNISKKADAYGILLLEPLGHVILDSYSTKTWACAVAPQLCSRLRQTHTELRSPQVSSVADLQELALTCWNNQILILLLLIFLCVCFYFFIFTLWEKKHLNRLWPRRAVLIASWNLFNKKPGDASEGTMTHLQTKPQRPCPLPPWHHKNSNAHTHSSIKSIASRTPKMGQIRKTGCSYWSWMAANIDRYLFPLLAASRSRHRPDWVTTHS